MRYAEIKYNDVANAPGVCLSVYLQGCSQQCPHCFNQNTWDFNGGKEFTSNELDSILNRINENGIDRNLCILGGEPLHENNLFTTLLIITTVKQKFPNKKIYLWTGYVYENLLKSSNPKVSLILDEIDYLIDGPYVHELRDINLPMRGSSNQRVINLKEVRK